MRPGHCRGRWPTLTIPPECIGVGYGSPIGISHLREQFSLIAVLYAPAQDVRHASQFSSLILGSHALAAGKIHLHEGGTHIFEQDCVAVAVPDEHQFAAVVVAVGLLLFSLIHQIMAMFFPQGYGIILYLSSSTNQSITHNIKRAKMFQRTNPQNLGNMG